jgi:hypothetical protein
VEFGDLFERCGLVVDTSLSRPLLGSNSLRVLSCLRRSKGVGTVLFDLAK